MNRNTLVWALLIIMTALSCILMNKCTEAVPQKYQQPEPQHELQQPDTMKDRSLHYTAVTQTAADNSELKEMLQEQKQLLKELDIKVKSIKTAQVTATASDYTIPMPAKPDTIRETDTVQAPYYYKDEWIEAQAVGDSLKISTHDSLTVIVSKIYRHKFLCWRWGTKGYEVQLVSHNPNSKITYNKTVINGKQ